MSNTRSSIGAPRDQVAALVLCGGQSRRMGSDKSQLQVGGQTLLGRTASLMERVAGTVWLACGSEERHADLGYRLVLDKRPGGGPLEGLRAGLEELDREWLLAVACDMPALEEGHFTPLFDAAHEADVDLVHYRDEDGNEPLCALYRRTVLPAVRSNLENGLRRMDSFWGGQREDGQPLAVCALAKNPEWIGSGDPFQNVNTPEDLDSNSCVRPASEDGA